MKKYFLMSLLPIMLFVSGFFFTHDASAYFKDNCYAIQYSEAGAGKDGTKTNIYSTKQLCYNNGKLETKERPNSKNTIGIGGGLLPNTPTFSISGDSVTLTYCKGGHINCVFPLKKLQKVYKLSDSGGDFETMVKEIDSFVGDLGNPWGCTKVGFGTNDAVSNRDGVTSGGASGSDASGDDGETTYAGDACYNANANSQGWILCPTMRNLEYTAGSMDNILERWLSVDTNLYNASSPTAVVWEVMRDIANVIMVIIMLVIIFSQLTGVGIDNYGIKKMLPRLIAMAILINLSLVICELAIDLSNLLGTGLRNLFGGIGQSILAGRDAGDYVETFISTMVSVVMVAAGVIGAVAPTALTVHSIGAAGGASTTMIILVIVLALLVVFAAIAVFFVMLAARMIIIIGCVALAPVAFALYILPNTQGLYKKWFTAFKTALVVFPICGAVSGISYIIKGIVLTADEIHIWMGVVGMMAPFLVFFMLPSLLRGVLGTLGKVGDALTTMGNHVDRGARGIRSGVENSEWYKTAMKNARLDTDDARARRTMNRLQERLDRRGSLNRNQTRQYARAAGVREAYRQQQSSDQLALAEAQFGNESLDNLMVQWNDARVNGEVNEHGVIERMDTLNKLITKRYGVRGINAIGNAMENVGANDPRFDRTVNTLRQTAIDDKNFEGGLAKVGDLRDMINSNGVIDGERASLNDFAGRLGTDTSTITSDNDFANLTGSTLRRARMNVDEATGGGLTDERIHSLLDSEDNNIRSGLQSDVGKRDFLQNSLYQNEHRPEVGPPTSERVGAALYREQQAETARQGQEEQRARDERMAQNIERIADNLERDRGGPRAA